MIKSNELSNKFTLVIVGRSGSGKGTLAEFILKKLGKGAHHIETGKILRNIMRQDTATAARARILMRHGDIFPSWFAVYAWLRELIEVGGADKHLVFDGSPRTVYEAKILDEVMLWHGRSLPLCIYVDVNTKLAEKRLLARGRADDRPSAIKNRQAYFPKFVLPVIDYYKKQNRLIRVDGSPLPEHIWKELDMLLKKRIGGLWR